MRPDGFAFFLSFLVIWIASGSGQADVAKERFWQVQSISDRGVLTLSDGQQLCLGGLWLGGHASPNRRATGLKQALDTLIDDRPLRLVEGTTPSFDRYGCLVASVETDQGVSLQHALLQEGMALVNPSLGAASSDEIDARLVLENEARFSRIGLWRDPAMQPREASSMLEHVGRISLVEGRVVRVFSNDRYAYLNFGEDWRTDFTVRLRQKLLKRDGVEPDSFDGKKLRIRGFVQESRGPLIDISNLKQIEVIP